MIHTYIDTFDFSLKIGHRYLSPIAAYRVHCYFLSTKITDERINVLNPMARVPCSRTSFGRTRRNLSLQSFLALNRVLQVPSRTF